jgi:hypothetical protein
MRRTMLAVIVLLVAAVSFTTVATAVAGGGPECIARGITTLRAKGPAGLKEALDNYRDVLAKGPRPQDRAWQEAVQVIDGVAAQRDAWASRLFWYTDLEQAKAAAASQGKPILSLRLLGTLDTELSCANSRFFRTTLYPDPRVNTLLREKFILHWSSERPVPVVTVDYGDGRTMKRTVTGNSIHYVLDESGRPIDALPGLYSASAFVRTLQRSLELAASKPTDTQLWAWHAHAAAQPAQTFPMEPSFQPQVEALVRSKAGPAAFIAGLRAASKARVEDPLAKLLSNLQRSIAEDTHQNENVLHRQVHQHFAVGQAGDFDKLNTWVYAEVFLTPQSDPWLGLAPVDAYPALEDGGLARTPTQNVADLRRHTPF